jgi:hypothetical protein
MFTYEVNGRLIGILSLPQAARTIVRFAPAACATVQNVFGFEERARVVNGPPHGYIVPSFIATCKHNGGPGNCHFKLRAFEAFRV